MSLVGNLEDLGLGEILQIVNLSRKTGVLYISSRGREGAIYFRQGQVVKATSSTYQQSLGEVLIQKGIIDLAVLRKALSLQQERGFRERLGLILVNNFGVSLEVIDEVVREQIENVVYSLFAWAEGSFNFEVQNNIETVDGTRLDPLQFVLDQGLNPQFLAVEGVRILGEKRLANRMEFTEEAEPESQSEPAYVAAARPAPVESACAAVNQPVIIVDDDGPTLRTLSEGLTRNGFVVHPLTRSEDALIKVDALHRGGEHPTVLIDLIMPKMDGSGVLGGLELLELLHNNFKDMRLVVMTDYHHDEAEIKVRELGYPFILKPRRVEVNSPVILRNFFTQLLCDILNPLDQEAAGNWQYRFNLGEELRNEMEEDDDVPAPGALLQSGGRFSLLRGMLEELNNPDLQGGVLLLVLRFASEFLNRAIVFTISNRVVSGSGQFGISGGKINGDERVRSIHFPLESESMFKEPFRTGQSITFKPGPNAFDMWIFEQLGGGVPDEVFIGPIVSQSQVIGFLYGDNLPGNQPVGDMESLAIFLSQAGIALEKSVLERQLHERDAK